MKYIKPYNEDSIPFNSKLVDLFNEYKYLAEPMVKYFKEYLGMDKIDFEMDLRDFIDLYLDSTKYDNGSNLESKIGNLYYKVNMYNSNYEQIKYQVKIHISSKDIIILIDGSKPVCQVVSDLIRFECKNGNKFINIVKKLKEYNGNLMFNILHSSKRNGVKNNLFEDSIGIEAITDALDMTNNFDRKTIVKVAPMIFKFGTDDEIKIFWDKITHNHNNYNIIMQILSKDKETPKTGYPDCRGYLNRLKQLVNLDDIGISNAKNLGEMGFSD